MRLSSICWLSPQVTTTARMGPGWGQARARSFILFPQVSTGPQALWLPSSCTLLGNWIKIDINQDIDRHPHGVRTLWAVAQPCAPQCRPPKMSGCWFTPGWSRLKSGTGNSESPVWGGKGPRTWITFHFSRHINRKLDQGLNWSSDTGCWVCG